MRLPVLLVAVLVGVSVDVAVAVNVAVAVLIGVFVGVAVGTLPVFVSQSLEASGEGAKRKRSRTAYNMAILERVRKDRGKYGVQTG